VNHASLYRDKDRAELLARLQRLSPDARAHWGKMDPAQALAHCQVPLRVGLGEVTMKRALIGRLFGGIAKRQLARGEPTKKGLPTLSEFRISDRRDFARERDALVALVDRFAAAGAAGTLRPEHPFFGKLSAAEWDMIMWMHIDHHLRQFGG
jgi:hypothetical protein